MRRACAVMMLLWAQTAFAALGHCEITASKANEDPCLVQPQETASPARASRPDRISRRIAIEVIRRVHNTCRILDGVAAQDERLALQIRSVRDNLRTEILAPIYKTHSDLAGGAQPSDGTPKNVRPIARATRKEISRATAIRLERTVTRIEQDMLRVASLSADQSADKDAAQAALKPFFNAFGELNFASQAAYAAYPDLWVKKLHAVPDQPRTAESDAGFRKCAPPIGSVKIEAAALTKLKKYMRQLRHAVPEVEWVTSVGWVTDRGSKGPNDADWISAGPGLAVGSYRRTQVPPDVIDNVGGIEIVFTAPDPSILAGKTIDVSKGKFALRD